MRGKSLIFIDLETTGTRATRDRIIEIAALKVVAGELIDRWQGLIQPDIPLPAAIRRLTGIEESMLEGAPRFDQVAPFLNEWLGDGELVAHNARFDYSFLRNEFKRAGIDYRASVICTLRMARRLCPALPRHDLASLLDHFAITTPHHHRANADAEALWTLWQRWQTEVADEAWQAALSEEQRFRSLPAHLDSQQLSALPTTPGVYLLYGHNQLPLYVGKSINLRHRVLGHFQRDHQDDREMRLAQQVQHIDWLETAGDLGAQLNEARLIKEMMPVMNRQLRRQGKLHTWYWPSDADTPILADDRALEMPQPDTLFGIYRSARDAKQALKETAAGHGLCPRILGLEKGKGRCFAHQLGKCRGACCGEESLEAHTARGRLALGDVQVGSWPWPGRVIIGEEGMHKRAFHAVEQWRYLGSADTFEQATWLSSEGTRFDIDTYRILNRFLKQPAQHRLTINAL